MRVPEMYKTVKSYSMPKAPPYAPSIASRYLSVPW